MNFSELENLMSSRGVTTLAEIARTLNTSPQAVSNWKSRDQVPHHIAANLSQLPPAGSPQTSDGPPIYSSPITYYASSKIYEEDTISLSDILLTMAEQLKVIVLTVFISVFIAFTYVQFIKKPIYQSSATILLPESKSNIGGLMGLASQFGVNLPTGVNADLSNPSLFPELIRSRTFAEKILDKKFFVAEYDKNLTLLAILTHGIAPPQFSRDTLISQAIQPLREIIEFERNTLGNFSAIRVALPDPVFAKELAEVVLSELEALNRYFKSKTVNEKLIFIEQRISSVRNELNISEYALKTFSEQNRQTSSPALQLEQERLAREVDIQKNIFLTLKQQLELAKIEEIQESSIVQVLDRPQVPLGPINKNLKMSIAISILIGLVMGILIGFVRSYFKQDDINERKKLRRVRNFFKKKGLDVFKDYRMYAIVSLIMFFGLPFYLGYESSHPVYFNRYSTKLMLINMAYIFVLVSSLSIFFILIKKKHF